MKATFVSCVSATFELDNQDIYFSSEKFSIKVNGTLYKEDVETNVFSIFNLEPNKDYEIEANGQTCSIRTASVSEIVSLFPGCDLQDEILKAKDNSLIELNKGDYHITSLLLRSNITINIKKGATLLANLNPDDYPEIPSYFTNEKGEEEVYGNWEGTAQMMKRSIVMAHHVENVMLVGEGTIDGQAQLSTWWIDCKKKTPRPHLIFITHSNHVYLQGLHIMNSPQWTIHPFFANSCGFYDLFIENPKISPNTDGLDPQSSSDIEIIGVRFSVGDDCIAVKSGKMDMATRYKRPCDRITIRNCWMQYGHGGVVLGSEMSGGITNLNVERCYFDRTDRGLRIKTRRGRGKLAIIDNVYFKGIKMDGVLSPITMNMFYFCDPDGKTEYVWSKDKLPVDDRTPYLGRFTFERIVATNAEQAAAYCYGLPEMPINEINIIDSRFSFREDAKAGTPAMMSFAEECRKQGFVFNNVKTVNIKNVTISGHVGNPIKTSGVEKITTEMFKTEEEQ